MAVTVRALKLVSKLELTTAVLVLFETCVEEECPSSAHRSVDRSCFVQSPQCSAGERVPGGSTCKYQWTSGVSVDRAECCEYRERMCLFNRTWQNCVHRDDVLSGLRAECPARCQGHHQEQCDVALCVSARGGATGRDGCGSVADRAHVLILRHGAGGAF
jgi:hypothetical protein